MYEDYWQLQKPAFRSVCTPDFFYQSSSQLAALLKLHYLRQQQPGLVLVTGLPGVGKTSFLQFIAHHTPALFSPIVDVLFPQLTARELLASIAHKLAPPEWCPAGEDCRLDKVLKTIERALLHWHQQQQHPLIVIDDAQLIEDQRVLDTLPQFLNYLRGGGPVFSVILSGQPELVGIIRRHPLLADRLNAVCVIEPLSSEETVAYVQHRLKVAGSARVMFDDSAMQAIARLSHGLPRRINRLCDMALLVGFAEQLPQITATEIESVAQELCSLAA
ncbi:MAG: hypothetical protein KatS3mg113_0598 [Planctomycetaceae bacterium]|nr:MAG: hypothetical protein KatS3mg113_0598 [Planctomycetaceae bacterium]